MTGFFAALTWCFYLVDGVAVLRRVVANSEFLVVEELVFCALIAKENLRLFCHVLNGTCVGNVTGCIRQSGSCLLTS